MYFINESIKNFKQTNLFENASSNEVKRRIFLFKSFMDSWWSMTFSSSLTDKSSKSVSVPDNWRLFNCTRNIVICEAQFVSKQLNQIRGTLYIIVDDCISSWSWHSLFGSHRNKIELISILVSDSRVYNSSRKRILESSIITCKKSCIYSFTSVDVEKFSSWLTQTA